MFVFMFNIYEGSLYMDSDIIIIAKRYNSNLFVYDHDAVYIYIYIYIYIFRCIYPFDPVNDSLTNWICYANYLLLAWSDMKVPKIESNIHIAGESIKLL